MNDNGQYPHLSADEQRQMIGEQLRQMEAERLSVSLKLEALDAAIATHLERLEALDRPA